MRIENFTEAFNKMGGEQLNESLITEATDRKDVLLNKFDKLNKIKEAVSKSLTNIDLTRDLDKLQNYTTVLDWVVRLIKEFKNAASESDDKFEARMKYADFYINKIADAVQSGRIVHESLLKESLNYLEK